MQFNSDKYWILHLGRNNELFTMQDAEIQS